MSHYDDTCHYNKLIILLLFYFTHTANPDIYTLSLHDALPISLGVVGHRLSVIARRHRRDAGRALRRGQLQKLVRSEEHTSELQSRQYLVCRLLLEKKNNKYE